jgi:hypothetical protein
MHSLISKIPFVTEKEAVIQALAVAAVGAFVTHSRHALTATRLRETAHRQQAFATSYAMLRVNLTVACLDRRYCLRVHPMPHGVNGKNKNDACGMV